MLEKAHFKECSEAQLHGRIRSWCLVEEERKKRFVRTREMQGSRADISHDTGQYWNHPGRVVFPRTLQDASVASHVAHECISFEQLAGVKD